MRVLFFAISAFLVAFFAPLLWLSIFTPDAPHQMARPATTAIVLPTPFAGNEFALPHDLVLDTAAALQNSEKVTEIIAVSGAPDIEAELAARGIPDDMIKTSADIRSTEALCELIRQTDETGQIIVVSQKYLLSRLAWQCEDQQTTVQLIRPTDAPSVFDQEWQAMGVSATRWTARMTIEATLFWASLAGQSAQVETQIDSIVADLAARSGTFGEDLSTSAMTAFEVTKNWINARIDQAKTYFGGS